MATTLTIPGISARIQWQSTSTVAGNINSANNNEFDYASGLMANGTGGTTTSNLIYASQLSIAASGAQTLRVGNTGEVTDFYGNSLTFARVKWMYFACDPTNLASGFTVGNASNPLVHWISSGSATVTVQGTGSGYTTGGGVLLLGCPGPNGYTVTNGTADSIMITNLDSVNALTVNVVLIGSTA